MDPELQVNFLVPDLNLRKQPRIMKNAGKISKLKDLDQKKLKEKK